MAKTPTRHDPIPPPRVPVRKTVAQRRATIQHDDAAAREAAEFERVTGRKEPVVPIHKYPPLAPKKRVPLSVVLAVCVLGLVLIAVAAYIFSQGGPPQ